MDTLILCLIFVSLCIVPLVMIFGGWIMRSTAQTEPNKFVGYRTQLSMASPEAWQMANSLCGQLWMRFGLALLLAGAAVMLAGLLIMHQMGRPLQTALEPLPWGMLTVVSAQTAVMILVIVHVERRLRAQFNRDGSRRR